MADRKAHDSSAALDAEGGEADSARPEAHATRDNTPVPMPALPVPMTARGEATRRRILDAAEGVFGEVGYYEASISEITHRAGVAQGTFYIYFHTKRDAFVELIEDIGNRLRAATSAAIAGTPDRIEAERRGFAAFLRFVAAHRQIYRIVEEANRVAPEAAREYYRRISQGYQRGLRAAMASGEIQPNDAEALAAALMGIGHFVALRWLIWPATLGATAPGADETGEASSSPPEVPEAVFAAVMEFIARGLGTPR
ncbi:MAG TPA: TetR/AcrR family transcriptional regulator [Ktedonobacterales bacterium]